MLSCELLILIVLIIAILKGMVRASATSPSKIVKTHVASILRKVDGAETIRVSKAGNDSDGDGSRDDPYLTINHAISMASELARIFIGGGNYDEQVDVNVDGVTLIGHGNVIIDTTTNGGTSLTLSGDNITVIGCKVDYGGGTATTNLVNITGETCILVNVRLYNGGAQTITYGININNLDYGQTQVVNTYIRGSTAFTIAVRVAGDKTLIEDCKISGALTAIDVESDGNRFINNFYFGVTTGIHFWAAATYNVSFLDTFQCTTDVFNEGAGNIVLPPGSQHKLGIKVTKTQTFVNSPGGTITLFTVTGRVVVKIIATCTQDVESAAAGVLEVGVASDVDAIIPTTLSTDLETGEIWHDATPDSDIEPLSTSREYIIVNGANIITTLSAQIDSGVIVFECFYIPLSDDGNVIATP